MKNNLKLFDEIVFGIKDIEGRIKKYGEKIATEIVKATTFYPAEEYHQKYLMKRGMRTCGI